MRRPKTDRVARTRAGGTWTEAAFWGFVRSLLRQGSIRWPPIGNALKIARRPNQSDNKRLKWEYQCSECGAWYSSKAVQVDHIEPCGELRCEADIGPFVMRLFCEQDKLRVICKTCHGDKTQCERTARALAKYSEVEF